jgi:hypothetical protein
MPSACRTAWASMGSPPGGKHAADPISAPRACCDRLACYAAAGFQFQGSSSSTVLPGTLTRTITSAR